ncbi:hypothetical protein [Kiloniella antarctica]|uniref:Uncharacterized protein n=1 Tax=Kiloniella antarctica TaxID=1550907 RepID=A0ABW5BD73_9PROT
MRRFEWQFSFSLVVLVLATLISHETKAGGGEPCQQPIVSRYCSSTEIDLLTPQKGRAKVLLKQILKIYRPELSLGSEMWSEDNDNIDEVTRFFNAFDIPALARTELGYLEGEKQDEKFLNDVFFSHPQCYAGGSFSNLAQYYQGIVRSGLDRETVRYLAFLRLLLVQDCVLDTDTYISSEKTKKHLQIIKAGEAKGWFDYIEAAAFYHDGFYPEAADLFATIAREETEAERTSGWLVETTRYMEILALFHKGREGQDDVFLPTVFNSFTEAFVSDFPNSTYRKHVEDMSVGIWLHYDERERYFNELIKMLSRRDVLNDRAAELDDLEELSINALLANITEISEYPIEHGNGFTLLPAILSGSKEISSLCAQVRHLPKKTPQELINYIGMSCAYLLKGTMPNTSVFAETPLYTHAKAFEAQALLLEGKLDEETSVFKEVATKSDLPLKDLLGLRSRQFEARLKHNEPAAFVRSSKLDGAKVPMELVIMDAVLYEQLSRYFLSAKELEESLEIEANELLRFSLIRPHLDEAMVQENWKAAKGLSALIQWQDLLANKTLEASDKLTIEIRNYAEVIEDVLALAHDNANPKALADVAYFLYKNHIVPSCGYERTSLIQAYLSTCDPEYFVPSDKGIVRVGSKSLKDIRAPVEIFSEALEIYKRKTGGKAEKARLLRVMIFCAKGAKNVAYCLRRKKIPKAHFKGWFEDLNLHYPSKERIEYWFYDLPDYSVFGEGDDTSVEQQYWYDEDAYLGYLDGGPYSPEFVE